jgi:hypothetical protein
MGLLKESSSDGCYTAPVPIWSKDKYKLQLMKQKLLKEQQLFFRLKQN